LALSIQPKVPELSKRAQLVPKFPGKVSRGKNRRMLVRTSKLRNIQPKIPQIIGRKLKGTELPGKKIWKIRSHVARLSSFLEIPENAV